MGRNSSEFINHVYEISIKKYHLIHRLCDYYVDICSAKRHVQALVTYFSHLRRLTYACDFNRTQFTFFVAMINPLSIASTVHTVAHSGSDSTKQK